MCSISHMPAQSRHLGTLNSTRTPDPNKSLQLNLHAHKREKRCDLIAKNADETIMFPFIPH